MPSAMTERLENRYGLARRRGPIVLLVVGAATATGTAGLVGMTRAEWIWSLAIAAGIAVAHELAVDRRWEATGPDDLAARCYVVGRTAAMFVLTVLNPFYALSACIGYFDADRYAPRRLGFALMLVTAVALAGAQSGGLPPADAVQAAVFAVLVLVNGSLVVFFATMAIDEAQVAADRDSTIAQLEQANARLAAALAENADLHDQLLVRAREAGRHEERERLAIEIHDTIAQSLMAVITQLEAARSETPRAPAALAGRLETSTELARAALGQARRSVEALLPAELDGSGLVDALKTLVEDWAVRTGVPARAEVTGTVQPVPAEVEGTVLRVAGEALANVERHAGAGRVGVTLSFMQGELALDVRDDGAGMPAEIPAGRFGVGGMRRRAERLGGELVIESEPGDGTAVQLRVPVRR